MYINIRFTNGSNPWASYPMTEEEVKKTIKTWTRNYRIVSESKDEAGNIDLLLEEKDGLYIVNYEDSYEWKYSELVFNSDEIKRIRRYGFHITDIINLKVSGKTYAERKDNLQALAIRYSHSDTVDLSYGELVDVQDFFSKNGKRYGLLTEFRENGII